MRRLHPHNLRAAWWAVRTARRTRRLLERDGLDAALAPPPPPPLPATAERGVGGALRRYGETCLVNAIVTQAWEAAHGEHRDLVIGTTAPGDFRAHAWLAGDPVPAPDDPAIDAAPFITGGTAPAQRRERAESSATYVELVRRPAPEYGTHAAERI